MPLLKPRFGRSPEALLAWALALGLAFTALRAYAMLGPVSARPLFLLHCVAMASTPWWLLTAAGRMELGLRPPAIKAALPVAIVVGVACAAFCFALGVWMFGRTADHWFVSVGHSYRAQPTTDFSLLQLHLMFTIPAMLFSPIGEEIFFRGLLQRALETRWSARRSAVLESVWFGAAHLVHHGLVLTAAGLVVRPVSGGLWFLLMTTLSLGFATLRKISRSILPAILAHSAFNATMNAFIFADLWRDLAS